MTPEEIEKIGRAARHAAAATAMIAHALRTVAEVFEAMSVPEDRKLQERAD